MKKIVPVLALVMVVSSVFLAGPAAAAEGDSSADTAVTSTETPPPDASADPPADASDEPPADESPADESPAADEPAAPVEAAPPAPAEDTDQAPAPGPVADEPAAAPASDESSRSAAPAPSKAPADADASANAPAASGSGTVSAAAAPAKVYVCKYVGKPGVDERLKTGKNPISVSSSSTGGAAVGNYFADGQDRSYVVAIDTGQPAPSTSACPAAAVPTQVTPVAPIVSAPTCTADGVLTLPTTPGVVYTVSPVYTGVPGAYVVTASAAPGYVLGPLPVTPFTVVVDKQLTGGACAVPQAGPKVWVCKYVGKPGVDEVLKAGTNPIEVSVNALPGAPTSAVVGQSFSDAQERSYVVRLSPATPPPTVADCLAPIVPDVDLTPEPPTVAPASCTNDGLLRMPTTAGITYAQSPVGTGPGSYTVTATADPGFRLVGTGSFSVVVDARVTGAQCATVVPPPGGGGGSNDPGEGSGGGGGGSNDSGGGSVELPDEPGEGSGTPIVYTTPVTSAFLPQAGGIPLWYLLLGGLLTTGGLLALRWGRPTEPVVHAGR